MRTLYAALAGFVLGVSAFFTFVVPEAAFGVLGGAAVGKFLAAVFPRFYALTAASTGLLAIVGAVTPNHRRVVMLAPIAALILTLLAWFVLLPAVNHAIGTPSFATLHGVSLGLDLVAMLLWLIGLAGLKAVRSGGIPRVR